MDKGTEVAKGSNSFHIHAPTAARASARRRADAARAPRPRISRYRWRVQSPPPLTPWQQTVLRPPPWTALLISARWLVRYGPGLTLKRRLLREWLDVGLRQNPRTARTVRTRYGQHLRMPTSMDLIARMVYSTGCWEPCLSAFVASRIRPGDGFIDIGANLGWYSTLASQLVGPTGTVVAIEPAAEQLRHNLELNGCGNVRIAEAAVTATPTQVTLYIPDRGNVGATTTLRPGHHAAEFTANGLPLRDLVRHNEIERAKIVKIDVEGAEGVVLAGLLPLVPQLRPDCEILVEISPQWLQKIGLTADDVLNPFRDSGFHPYRVENSYMPQDYPAMLRTPARPTRFNGPITRQTDLVLSRIDADSL